MQDSMIFLFIGLIWVVGFAVFGFNYFRGERAVTRSRPRSRPTLNPRMKFAGDRDDAGL